MHFGEEVRVGGGRENERRGEMEKITTRKK